MDIFMKTIIFVLKENFPINHFVWSCHFMSIMAKKKLKMPKGYIEIEKKDGQTIQCQWPKEKEERKNNDLQNIIKKTKERATRTPLRTVDNSGAPEG